jgi:acyl-CoA synthetase (NDP forming)
VREFFEPTGIAVIGANDGNSTAGARTLLNLRQRGYPGHIYPVSRRHPELHGLPAYPSVADIPDPVEMAVVAVSAEATPGAVRECGERGIRAAVLFAAGIDGETPRGRELRAELRAACERHGVRVVGPNTVGIRLVQNGLFATFAHDLEGGLRPGSIAVVAQSGGIGVYLGSAYLKRRLAGTRYLVDTGNEFDVAAADVVEHVTDDPEVSCVGLILEGARDGRRLARAVRRAVDAGKPVVFFKVGRSAAAARHIASHTGALASPAELFDVALRDAGAAIAHDEAEFIDALVIHEARRAPRGRRLGVVTPSGGYAILTIDAAEQFDMDLPAPVVAPTAEQAPALKSGDMANPFDWAARGAAQERTRPVAIRWMLGQPNVDAVLLWEAYSMEMPERRELIDAALAEALPGTDKPLFICGIATPEFEQRLREHGVLLFPEPMRLVRALGVVAPPRTTAPATNGHDPSRPPSARVVAGAAARSRLAGLPHAPTDVVDSAAQALACAERWSRLFLKVESDAHAHKTELGLIEGPLTAADVVTAYHRLDAARTAAGASGAPIVAQPGVPGVELALGAYLDPSFGPVVMVASGGIFTEILRDAQVAPAPVNEARAEAMIRRLRGVPLLQGARGRPPADIAAAARAVAALSRFIAEADGAYAAVDVNPLIVTADGAVAVDAVLYPAADRPADEEVEVR